MGIAVVTLQFEKDKVFKMVFERSDLPDQIRDLRSSWDKVEPILRRIATKQFASEGAYSGDNWKDLHPITLKVKAMRGQGGEKKLVASGKLRDSLARRTADSIIEKTPTQMRFGTKVRSSKGFPYALVHQGKGEEQWGAQQTTTAKQRRFLAGVFGWVPPPRRIKLPVRKIFRLTQDDKKEIQYAVRSGMVKAIRGEV